MPCNVGQEQHLPDLPEPGSQATAWGTREAYLLRRNEFNFPFPAFALMLPIGDKPNQYLVVP